MFGYVKPFIPELKVRQHELYKAVYCTICKRQRKLTGVFPTFFLSYDFVFLALVRLSLNNAQLKVKDGRCIYNPLRHRAMIESNSELDYTACASTLLTYYKILDDVQDSKGIKKLFYSLLIPFAKRSAKRAGKHFDLPDDIISECLANISDAEKSGDKEPEYMASLFGVLLSSLASYNEDDLQSYALEKIFDSLGRWIYLVDAADDLEKDIKKHRYNPFSNRVPEFSTLNDSLSMILSVGDDCLLGIHADNPDLTDLITNIYKLGTETVQTYVLKKALK